MIITLFCRRLSFRSFYRVKPRAAQASSLALECWYIALGGSIVLGRVVQYLLAAAFWVGRCDVPFLHPDVQLFGYAFDYVPTHFTKELLVHEAHRHPFIERLAQMYLMKLRHARFVNNAGAAWRQLAVLALFPWLRKHRVLDVERLNQAKRSLLQEKISQMNELERPAFVRAASALVPQRGLGSQRNVIGRAFTRATGS